MNCMLTKTEFIIIQSAHTFLEHFVYSYKNKKIPPKTLYITVKRCPLKGFRRGWHDLICGFEGYSVQLNALEQHVSRGQEASREAVYEQQWGWGKWMDSVAPQKAVWINLVEWPAYGNSRLWEIKEIHICVDTSLSVVGLGRLYQEDVYGQKWWVNFGHVGLVVFVKMLYWPLNIQFWSSGGWCGLEIQFWKKAHVQVKSKEVDEIAQGGYV